MRTLRTWPSWLWAIPLLILAAGLGISGLNKDAFGWDEVSSMNAVGGTTPGLSLIDTWNNVTQSAPDQAVGFALMLSQWGRLVGWTEFATRALPFFAGLLALAWVYRLGRDLFSPSVGLIALLVMATSVYFVIFMHQLRVFTFIALVVSLTLWCYWRVTLHPRPPGPASQIGLLVGFVGLFYTHYFAALFLGALGLYHLLFAPKTRRWWRPILAAVLAGLIFLPEYSVFLNGIAANTDKEQLHQMAIGPLAVVYYLLLVFSNEVLPLILLAGMGIVLGLRQRINNRNVWMLLFLTLSTLLLIIGANQVMQVMTLDRLRYLMPLWPLMALVVGLGLWHLVRQTEQRPLRIFMLLAWPLVALWTMGFTDLGSFVEAPELPWREMRADLQQMGSPASDVFMFHGVPSRIREYYVASTIPMRREIIESWDTDESLRAKIDGAARVWIGTDWRWYEEFPIDWSQQPEFAEFTGLMNHEFIYCQRFIDAPFMRLDLYARSQIFCPDDTALMRFGTGITLSAVGTPIQTEDSLTVDMVWQIASEVPDQTYSVALHVFEMDNQAFVTAADYGLPEGPVGLAAPSIDLSALPQGRYVLQVGVYAWQDGTRLPGTDLVTAESSDLLPLFEFDVQ